MPKILIVDDDERIHHAFELVLTSSSYEAISAFNIAHAKAILESQPIKAIVLDLNLGAESGLSFLKSLRQSGNNIPVVIFSGGITPDIREELEQAGANEVIEKPDGIMRVMKAIERLLVE